MNRKFSELREQIKNNPERATRLQQFTEEVQFSYDAYQDDNEEHPWHSILCLRCSVYAKYCPCEKPLLEEI